MRSDEHKQRGGRVQMKKKGNATESDERVTQLDYDVLPRKKGLCTCCQSRIYTLYARGW